MGEEARHKANGLNGTVADEDRMSFEDLREHRFCEFLKEAVHGDECAALDRLQSYLIMFGSAERPYAFLDALTRLRPSIFWRAFHLEWSGFDRIPHKRFARLLSMRRGEWRPDYMEPNDRAAYDALPESMTIYRGQSGDDPVGLSWTLDRTVAEGFARGHRFIPVHNPVIVKATVLRNDVAGFYQERNEAEVVLFSAGLAKRRVRSESRSRVPAIPPASRT